VKGGRLERGRGVKRRKTEGWMDSLRVVGMYLGMYVYDRDMRVGFWIRGSRKLYVDEIASKGGGDMNGKGKIDDRKGK